jgi:DNA mismatch repair ATPase MutS
MEQDIINDYQQRAASAQAEADKYGKLVNTYSFLRLGIFILLIVAIYFGYIQDDFTIVAVSFVLLMFAFAWLVSRQSEFERQRAYFKNLVKINENEIQSMVNHANIYNNGQQFADEKHYYTSDLDIFGNASLFQLIDRSATSAGNKKLAGWLTKPALKEDILLRQGAVNELSSKKDWKQNLQAKLLFAANENTDQLQQLFTYLKVPLQLSGEKWITPYIKVAPYLLTGMLIGGYFYPVLNLVAIIVALFNMFILYVKGSYMIKSSLIADKIGQVLANYAQVFKHMEDESWEQGRCNNLAEKLKTNQTSKHIAELSRLINKLSYSLIMIVGFVLNLFFLWALKQVIAIENWKRNNQQNLEDAFEVVAEYEALISLASLRINYPGWCMPGIAEGKGYTLSATQIAHPLIKTDSSIANDYALTDTFKIDIITGSNMAGKSTFLRTIGINTVLALCGAPVCAEEMRVSVITILSYMRIKDSLNESTSTFKAELDRLQMLLAAVDSDAKVFFLIDEMLRGTNSVDKYLGSKAVIEQLIAKKGVGMVATHDLQIAQLEKQYPDYIRNFYFDIQVKDGEMLFDYKIKHGECKTFNASLLLKQIGINVKSD